MRRGLAVCFAGVAAVAVWLVLRDVLRPYNTNGSHVDRVTIHSKILGRDLEQVLITPPGGGRGRMLLVFLHGRSWKPETSLSDQFFEALNQLGPRAPNVLLANGGDHSYWHDRRDGRWGTYVLREAIPLALSRTGADPDRVAIGGISMGGFGALDLARLAPKRFCAVGGHSAALWLSGGETPAGAFDDAADFARHDVIGVAHKRLPYKVPVWLDAGLEDPFLEADTRLAEELRARSGRVSFHTWPGGHDSSYWRRHMSSYLRFYSTACA